MRLTSAGQTFEGGISAKPEVEAHGAYAFCALACLCIIDDPHIVIPRYELTIIFLKKY
jgi:protein farnesyltransferase subunit beta